MDGQHPPQQLPPVGPFQTALPIGVDGEMAPPSKNSPLPNPFFAGSPRSSISGKDSLGRIPSISSLKSTVDKINSPARRMSSTLAQNSSENEKPAAMKLGKHFHSYDDLGNHDGSTGPSVKRRSPRKLPKMKQFPSEVFDLDRLLATQKTLFKLRTKISELIEVGDLFSAHHWLLTIVNEPSMATALHWSDYYRFFKSCSVQKMPVKLILEAIESFESSQKEAADIHLTLLKVDLMAKEGIWEQIVTLSDLLDLESYGTDGFGHNWEREQFPPRWVPSISPEMIKARFFHFIGLAHRNLGAFEKAIDAFDLSTQFCPYVHASVAELMYETNALIPAAQRQQYLDTLALGSLKYSPEIELLFNAGKFEKVLEVTTPFFRDSKNLLSDDRNLLVLHLSSLLALKKSDELFVMAHKLVDAFPQDAISWYAVGLYYEANDRLDDSRRYLMKSCSKDEKFGPAWLMLGHSFSRSGDHDQAVSAYALLARHTAPASIYPRLFLAIEFLKTKQVQSANMYLIEAFNADRTNPLIMNEIGVLYVLQKNFVKAINMFNSAHLAWKQANRFASVPILTNLAAVYVKFIPIAQNIAIEISAGAQVVDELLKFPLKKLTAKTLIICAAIFELKASITEDNGALYGRAADLYHEVLLHSKQDKMALMGYNRCLVFKVQNSAIPSLEVDGDVGDVPPPTLSDDDIAMDIEPGRDEALLCTPVKNHPQLSIDVESSPISYSEQPTASRPPTLRRRLTSLSFTCLDDDLDTD